ncbi:cysteine desulfurase [Spirochaeta cellobiosiphila]|uniref:cysteine desulfurase n=1 Tax=Spirochaeta cellobiosiphila TaxID=504483 RepID=UPI0003F833DF|nr:cysteine desulfurase [Spirochaeta cellobiosiphila]
MSYDFSTYRKDFPILNKEMRGNPFSYLDNAATSLTPNQVIQAESDYYLHLGANIKRGVYEFSEKATWDFENVRRQVAEFLNARSEREIIFTRNASESLNLVAYSYGDVFIKKGDKIVATEMEHHSNLVPWQELAQRKGATLDFIPLLDDATLDEDSITKVIDEKTKIVAITAMSNVTGYMPPIKKVIEAAHKVGAVVVVDGAQYASHHKVDLIEMDADFFAISAHKMLGPTGVGVLYGKKDLLDKMKPFLYGGDMIQSVKKDKAKYLPTPEKFEAGTPNIAGVLAFGKALEYLNTIDLDKVLAHEKTLLNYALELAAQDPDITVYGPKDTTFRGGVFSFNVGDIHPHDTGSILDNQGIAVRTGFHCAQPLMIRLGVPGTTRASFYFYNTKEDVDRLFKGLQKVKEVFK